MDIHGAKFQELCCNISRDIIYSVFTTFQLQYCDIITDLICIIKIFNYLSLKQKKIFQKDNCHSSIFWKAFHITRKQILCHIHFKSLCSTWNIQLLNIYSAKYLRNLDKVIIEVIIIVTVSAMEMSVHNHVHLIVSSYWKEPWLKISFFHIKSSMALR